MVNSMKSFLLYQMQLSLFDLVFIFSVLAMLMMKSHFLMMLLFLEMMSTSIFFKNLNNSFEGDGSLIIMFLTCMVLEATFGLSLLIYSSRKMGTDFFSSSK